MLEELVKKAGSKSALARILGISAPAVIQWKKIPAKRLKQLRELKPEWFDSAPQTV